MIYFILLIGLFLLASVYYFGRKTPGYSHVEHTISELAATGTSHADKVSWCVFLPVGLASGIVAFLTINASGTFLLSGSLAIGYIFAAFFPIDKNAPAAGSWKNTLHNISAGISYVLAMSAFELIETQGSFPAVYGTYFIIAFIVSFFVPQLRAFKGLLQRLVEAFIFVTLIVGT